MSKDEIMMEKKIYWNIVGFVFLLGAIFSGFLVYSNLDKGLIFNDEAYYLFHFREYKNVLTVDSTNFFRIFQVFYTENIYHFRLITYALLNLSTFLVFYFFAKYFKLKIQPIFIGSLGIAFNFITWNSTNIVLNQYIGNTVLVNFSLLFLVLTLLYRKSFLLLLSGFFLGFVLFDGIPHTLVIAPISLFVLYIYGKKEKRKVLYFGSGIIIAIGIYFTFIQSFSNFVDQFQYLKYYKEFHNKQHPKSFYFVWIAEVAGYIFIPGIFFHFIINKIKKTNVQLSQYLFAGVIIAAVVFMIINGSGYIKYFILLLLVLRYLQADFSTEKKSIIVLLFLLPFCLSFGSGAYFDVRSDAYFIYFILTLIIIIVSLYSFKYTIPFLLYFLFTLYNFTNFPVDKGWKGFIYTAQTEPVLINNHIIYLDKERKKDIEDLRPYLQKQNRVIYSHNKLMGYLYILNAKPPIPYYFTLKNYVKFIIDKKGDSPDQYIYVESNDHPFSPKEIIPLQFVNHPEKYTKIKTGRFTLYLPANFQKK